METHQVLRELARWHAHGVASALATVVRVQGSAYRHEGAKLAVAADGSSAGNVSGGCLEADVREVAARVIASGVAERRRYCGGSDEIAAWDLGVGCEGVVELLVEPAPPASVHAPALDALDAGHAFITVTR
ncbi:MAG: XdhC family protein, partial [Gemmatimonadaceae bacterium]|nr:XdhC family protein [Gemmatimonadaceae bacterium]MCU0627452.1 XdhC family protein [Gemmatimonadaceae bacterium]